MNELHFVMLFTISRIELWDSSPVHYDLGNLGGEKV